MYFINNNPSDILKALSIVTQKRLYRALKNKGYPPATNVNNWLLVATGKKGFLYYRYGSKPTMIMELLPMEMPTKNWQLKT